MTTEEIKRLTDALLDAAKRDGMLRQIKLLPEAKAALHAAIDSMAAQLEAAEAHAALFKASLKQSEAEVAQSARDRAELAATVIELRQRLETAECVHGELSRDSDGDIAIDYATDAGVLSISVSATGKLSWAAGLDGTNKTESGTVAVSPSWFNVLDAALAEGSQP